MKPKKLPKATEASNIGDRAVSITQNIFERNKCKFRRQDGVTDFGIDAEVEFVEKMFITGKLLKIQVKGTSKIRWGTDNTYRVRVNAATWNLWREMSLPVFAVACSVSEEKSYWCFPISVSPIVDSNFVTLVFNRKDCLNSAFSDFEFISGMTLKHYPDPSVVLEVPGFYEISKALSELAEWHPDTHWPIDRNDDFLIRLFYRHVLRLRISVGLPIAFIIPLESFYLRSVSFSEYSEGALIHEVFSELLSYLVPLYSEALRELKRRSIDVDRTFENQEIINFLRNDSIFNGYQEGVGNLPFLSLSVRDSRINPISGFQRQLEALLLIQNVPLRLNHLSRNEIKKFNSIAQD